MDADTKFDVEKAIREVLSDGKDLPCIFDRVLDKFEKYSTRAASTIGEIKRRDNKRSKGNGWEDFCEFYLKRVLKYKYVWTWKEIPPHIRAELKLGSKVDNGIDLVARFNDSCGFVAVQCKYRQDIRKTVTWTQLSTFVGLCCQTGPWDRHIVMTNCKGVSRRTGIPKTSKDQTIAYGTFKNITRTDCMTEEPESFPKMKSITLNELREARLAKFSFNNTTS
jgi:hypothetical protein